MRLGVEVSQAVRTDGYEIYSGWKLAILSRPLGLTPPVARERERDGGRKGREEGRETLNICCVVVCLVLNKDKRTNKIKISRQPLVNASAGPAIVSIGLF